MKKQIVSTLMMAVFTLVFLLSAGMLLAYYGEGVRQQQAFRALERITEQANNHDGENSKTAAVQTEQSAKEKAVYQSFHTHPSYQLKVMSPPPGVQSSTTKSKLPR